VGNWSRRQRGSCCYPRLGFIEPYEIDGSSETDWGVSVAFTEKFISKSVMQSIVFSRHFYEMYRANRAILAYRGLKRAKDGIGLVETMRNALHTLYAGFEMHKPAGVVVVEVPGLGCGVEASAYLTRGTTYVSNSSDHDLGDDS
jgi:hypothetical protein